MSNTAIVWFRNDLRVLDNEALFRACSRYERIVPVFCLDPDVLDARQYGFPKIGDRRLNFLMEGLRDLKSSLQELGGDLVFRMDDPADEIARMADELDAEAVYAHKEVTWEETTVEKQLQHNLPHKVELKFFWGNSLYHVNDLPFEYGKTPHVFTRFRKKLEKYSHVRDPFPKPESVRLPKGIEHGKIPGIEDLREQPRVAIDERAVLRFTGGESEALKRLDHYFWRTEELSRYKFKRNGLIGADYSSKFSAWLAQGNISPRTIYQAVKQYESEVKQNVSTYWLIFELIWRDFFRFIFLKHRNRMFHLGGIQNKEMPDEVNSETLDRWITGNTGVPFVDANMRELWSTGYMSNRGRQNAASFWVHDLKQDWRAGAAWFESRLIDYDVCSNWGNWAYVSGVGNDPRDRKFNVISQSRKYDAKGDYVKLWCPELEELDQQAVQKPWEGNGNLFSTEIDYPEPILVSPYWDKY